MTKPSVPAAGSAAFLVYWDAVGDDPRRKALAGPAWAALDELLLPSGVFSGKDFTKLIRCIEREASDEQRRPQPVPTISTPDAETLPPMMAPPEEEDPSFFAQRAAAAAAETLLPMQAADEVISTSPPLPSHSDPPPEGAKSKRTKATTGSPLVDVYSKPKPKPSRQLTLPELAAEPERVAPSSILRSALFGPTKRATVKRVNLVNERIAVWGTTELTYSGPPLDQADLDVLLQLVHLTATAGRASDEQIPFRDKSMMSSLKRTCGGSDLRWLDQVCRDRLAHAHFTIRETSPDGVLLRDSLIAGIISGYSRDLVTGRRQFSLNPRFLQLLTRAGSEYTLLNWRGRLELNSGLAKWLHGFLMSHAGTKNGVYLTLIMKLSGRSSMRLRQFRTQLEGAIAELLALDDLHLGLKSAEVLQGLEGPKLVWRREPDRKTSLTQLDATH